MESKNVLGLLCFFLLASCGHSLMRGHVVMKLNDERGHICLGEGEVRAGDKVALYRNDCSAAKTFAKSGNVGCQKIKVGEGTVTQVLNEHYSVIQVQAGVKFEEGTTVEKMRP